MYRALLNAPDDFDGWRDAARRFALAGIPPQDIEWQVRGEAVSGRWPEDEPPIPA